MTFDFYKTKTYQDLNNAVDLDKEYFAHEIKDIQYPKGSVVAIYDLDTICFPVSSATDERVILVTKNGKTKQYKNRTEFKKICKNKGWNIDDFNIVDHLIPEPVENCLYSVRKSIEKAKEDVGATHCEFYLGGSDNFRLELPLPVQYKSNRKDHLKPTHLKASQDYVIKKYGAKRIKGVECDDMVNIRAIAINKQEGVKGVIITTDKDVFATFTDEIYAYRQGELHHLNSYLGELHLKESGGVIGTGLKWQCTQALITGDATDEYLPRRHFNKKYGEKSWYKDVKDLNTVEEFLNFTVNKFKSLVGDNITFTDWKGVEQNMTWLELADLYWSAAFMRRYPDDDYKFSDVLKENNIECG